MLKLFGSSNEIPVLSLRVGGPIGATLAPIINPNNLFIEGWYVQDNRGSDQLVLLSNDIREVIPQGFAINDYDVLVRESELLRMQEILKIQFNPIGLRVVSASGQKYGKINDFAFETNNMFIQKLYAVQSIVKSLNGNSLSIDRSQIIEITNSQIVIEDPTDTATIRAASPA